MVNSGVGKDFGVNVETHGRASLRYRRYNSKL